MTKKTNLIKIMSVAVATVGMVGTLSAENSSDPANVPQEANYGLIGESYGGFDYSYTHLDGSPFDDINGFRFRYNKPLYAGLDFGLGYEWGRSDNVGNVRLKQQELTASVTAYTDYSGNLRPFVQPGIGWTWSKAGSAKSDSFLYFVGAGVELQVAQSWVVSPYVQFVDATEYSGSDFNLGVKSAYRFNRSWGLQGDVSIDDDQNTGLAIGVNYHF